MKEKLTRNIGLKILSIILAVILWLIITNVDDPMTKISFTKKVEILNADKITALNQVYNITEGSTIDFTAAARRSVADHLSENDFVVTADLSKLTDLKTVTINIKYLGPSTDEVNIISGLNQVMKVDLEKLVKGHFKVVVEQSGELGKGLYVYEKTASTILQVSGPQSKINKIGEVVVDVDVTGYTKSFTSTEQPKVLDQKGKVIDPTNLSFSKTYIPVFIGIYNTKKVNLNITPSGNPMNGYVMSAFDYEPKTIEIAAEDNLLNSINDVSFAESIEGASDNIEEEVNLQEKLPSGVILVGDNQTAVLNATIEKAVSKEFTIVPADLDIKNKPSNLKLDYLTTMPITLKVSGPEKEMDKLTQDNLKPYIDLTNYSGGGTYSVKVDVDLPDHSTMVNAPRVNVRLLSQ